MSPWLPSTNGDSMTGQQKLIALLSGTLGGAAIWYLWKRYDNRNLPPGPTGWPLVGCKALLEGDKLTAGVMALGKKYGDMYSVQNGQK